MMFQDYLAHADEARKHLTVRAQALRVVIAELDHEERQQLEVLKSIGKRSRVRGASLEADLLATLRWAKSWDDSTVDRQAGLLLEQLGAQQPDEELELKAQILADFDPTALEHDSHRTAVAAP